MKIYWQSIFAAVLFALLVGLLVVPIAETTVIGTLIQVTLGVCLGQFFPLATLDG